MLPNTSEWQLAAVVTALAAVLWLPMLGIAAGMLCLTAAVVAVQAGQAPLPPRFRSARSRAVVAALCYCQPMVRAWARYHARFFPPESPFLDQPLSGRAPRVRWLLGPVVSQYWDEDFRERIELLQRFMLRLTDNRWTFTTDSGWERWDLQIFGHPWTQLQVTSTQEDHGGGKRLIRLRYRLRATGYLTSALLVAALTSFFAWTVAPVSFLITAGTWALLLIPCLVNGSCLAERIHSLEAAVAAEMGLIRIMENKKDFGEALKPWLRN